MLSDKIKAQYKNFEDVVYWFNNRYFNSKTTLKYFLFDLLNHDFKHKIDYNKIVIISNDYFKNYSI